MIALPGPAGRQRIGLFGGSFNPAHDGHLHVAETALKRLRLDRVWWLVARGNPLKPDTDNFADRLASARAIVGRHPKMRVSDLEAKAGLTYTADTLDWLRARAPRAQFVFIMGADSLAGFHRWRNWQGIARIVPIFVVARPGAQMAALNSPFVRRFRAFRVHDGDAAGLASLSAPAWCFLSAPLNSASSTVLRAKNG